MQVHLVGLALPWKECFKVFRSMSTLKQHVKHCRGQGLVNKENIQQILRNFEVVLEED